MLTDFDNKLNCSRSINWDLSKSLINCLFISTNQSIEVPHCAEAGEFQNVNDLQWDRGALENCRRQYLKRIEASCDDRENEFTVATISGHRDKLSRASRFYGLRSRRVNNHVQMVSHLARSFQWLIAFLSSVVQLKLFSNSIIKIQYIEDINYTSVWYAW